jgi:hypothetical protein
VIRNLKQGSAVKVTVPICGYFNATKLTRLIASCRLNGKRCCNKRIWCARINPLHAVRNHNMSHLRGLEVRHIDVGNF